MTNRNISETVAQLASIAPSAQAAGTQLSSAFKLNQCRKAMISILVGTPGTNGTVDAKITSSATVGGTYTDVAGAAIAQRTTAGVSQIELRADRVNAIGAGPFFKLSLTVGTATTPTAALVQGSNARFEPASDYNEAAVSAPAVVI